MPGIDMSRIERWSYDEFSRNYRVLKMAGDKVGADEVAAHCRARWLLDPDPRPQSDDVFFLKQAGFRTPAEMSIRRPPPPIRGTPPIRRK